MRDSVRMGVRKQYLIKTGISLPTAELADSQQPNEKYISQMVGMRRI